MKIESLSESRESRTLYLRVNSMDDPVVREIEKVVIKNPGGDSVKFFDASSKKSFVSERYSYISYSEDIADQISGLIGRDNVVLK